MRYQDGKHNSSISAASCCLGDPSSFLSLPRSQLHGDNRPRGIRQTPRTGLVSCGGHLISTVQHGRKSRFQADRKLGSKTVRQNFATKLRNGKLTFTKHSWFYRSAARNALKMGRNCPIRKRRVSGNNFRIGVSSKS